MTVFSNEEDMMAEDKKSAPKKKKRVRSHATELVRLRNFFYRDGYRRLSLLLLILIVLNVVSVLTVYYLVMHRPPPSYFATNIQGGIVPLTPLSKPSLPDALVRDWAARAVSAAFSFNYEQYRDQLQETSATYFTADGGKQFMDALTASGNIDFVTAGKLIAIGQVKAAPTLGAEGVLPSGAYKGRYYWRLTIPLEVLYQGPSIKGNVRREVFDVSLLIVRDNTLVDNSSKLDSAKGIGIAQFLARSASGALPPGATATSQMT
ncbi:MAG: type IVB secretion system apparatus protein IcmL/DotI [Gammaproteobacteria bacterium]